MSVVFGGAVMIVLGWALHIFRRVRRCPSIPWSLCDASKVMNSLTFDTVTPIPKGSKEEIQFIPRISPLTQVLPGDSQITGATRNYDDVTLCISTMRPQVGF
jgi:hypothetical protein